MDKPLLRALAGRPVTPAPIWLMRQAGRYLPEYRKVRARTVDFMTLCFTPELAAEITLQPVRRYAMDAAILFSDILTVPHALGREVRFEEGRGPRLEPLRNLKDLSRVDPSAVVARLGPVYETLQRVKAELAGGPTALIGFAGAPWTVASYMIEGGSSRDFAAAKALAYGSPVEFQSLIDILVEATAAHLIAQVEAGAEALQIFDSWAGVWPEADSRRWCLLPTAAIIRRVKAAHPLVPVILFPRGVGAMYEAFARESGADALSLDTTVPLAWARAHLQAHVPVQGNLDPLALLVGGKAMEARVRAILDAFGDAPFVFNLGHGVVPATPLEHVARLVALVRGA